MSDEHGIKAVSANWSDNPLLLEIDRLLSDELGSSWEQAEAFLEEVSAGDRDPYVEPALAMLRCELRLRQQAYAEAEATLDALPEHASFSEALLARKAITIARLHLAFGRCAEAKAELEEWPTKSSRLPDALRFEVLVELGRAVFLCGNLKASVLVAKEILAALPQQPPGSHWRTGLQVAISLLLDCRAHEGAQSAAELGMNLAECREDADGWLCAATALLRVLILTSTASELFRHWDKVAERLTEASSPYIRGEGHMVLALCCALPDSEAAVFEANLFVEHGELAAREMRDAARADKILEQGTILADRLETMGFPAEAAELAEELVADTDLSPAYRGIAARVAAQSRHVLGERAARDRLMEQAEELLEVGGWQKEVHVARGMLGSMMADDGAPSKHTATSVDRALENLREAQRQLAAVAFSVGDPVRRLRLLSEGRHFGERRVRLLLHRGDQLAALEAAYEVKALDFFWEAPIRTPAAPTLLAGLAEAASRVETAEAPWGPGPLNVLAAWRSVEASTPSTSSHRTAGGGERRQVPTIETFSDELESSVSSSLDMVPRPKKVLRRLRRGELAVEYLLSTEQPRSLWTFLLRKDGLEVLRRDWKAEDEEARRWAMRLADGEWEVDGRPARALFLPRLYEALVLPWASKLLSTKRLVVALGGMLEDVPFGGVLEVAERRTGALPSHSYVITTAQLASRRKEGLRTALLLAGRGGGPSLEGAEREIFELRSLLEVSGVRVLDERMDAADLESVDLVHFAGHAQRGDDGSAWLNLDLSSLGLGATDFSRIRFRRRPLVVLSGCDTGYGAVVDDGVTGFRRETFAAGASGLVCARRPVRDDLTRLLMGRFYKLLLNGKLSPAVALWEAQQGVAGHRAKDYTVDEESFRCYAGLEPRPPLRWVRRWGPRRR